MSSFAVLLLCIQACFVQNVFSSCVGNGAGFGSSIGLGTGLELGADLGLGLAPAALAPAPCAGALNANHGLRPPAAAIASSVLGYGGAVGSAYGGAGEGNVAVAGELPVAGNTAVAGQVPVIGVVNFRGAVPAAGAVSISGKCACGCGNWGPRKATLAES